MLLEPFNSSINIFMKKALLCSCFLSLLFSEPSSSFLSSPRPDHLCLSFGWFRKQTPEPCWCTSPCRQHHVQLIPACVLPFLRLPNANLSFVAIFVCIFSLILLYVFFFLMFSSIFLFSLFDQCIWLYQCHQDHLNLQDHQNLLTHHSPLIHITSLYLKYSYSYPLMYFCSLIPLLTSLL